MDSGLATTCTFNFTGNVQTWQVPAGVEHARFTVVGAAGGDAAGRPGGNGGGVVSILDVTPGTVYRLYVGGKGASDTDESPGQGGWNGGDGGNAPLTGALPTEPRGAGGGGSSDVRVAPYGLADRVLVGGGGGGAGSSVSGSGPQGLPGAGGDGGGGGSSANGRPGGTVANAWVGAGGGGGGTASGAGFAGGASGGSLYNGCGIWDPAIGVAGETGGAGGDASRGGAGGILRSHWSSTTRCDQYAGWGGGGGGGWYGGGGGGGGITGGGGGGGGSAYAPPGSTNTPWGGHTHGQITINYIRTSADGISLGGIPMTSAPTTAILPGSGKLAPRHDVFYLNHHSAVIWRTITEGVPGPETNLGATLYPGSTIAALWTPYRLDLFGRGTESALWQKTYIANVGWTSWTARTAPGVLSSDPTVVSPSQGRLEVYFRGADAKLMQLISTDGTWTDAPAPVPAGPALSTGPGATVTEAGRIDLLAGCAGRLCWWSRIDGTWTYRGIASETGVTSTPSVSSPREGWIDVAVRNQDNAVTRLQHAVGGDWWGTSLPVSSPPGHAVALAPATTGTAFVYARGHDNTLTVRTLP
ncbi:MAG: glycine-rich protein [Nocardioides sp.]